MKFLSLMSGCGGLDLGLEKAGLKCVGQIEKMKYALKVLKKHWSRIPKHTDILTFCVRAGLVRVLRSQVKGKVSRISEQDSGEKWLIDMVNNMKSPYNKGTEKDFGFHIALGKVLRAIVKQKE